MTSHLKFYTHLALAILVLEVILVQVLHGFDIDSQCRSNGMRKPPRFGKRAGQNEFNVENQFAGTNNEFENVKRATGCFRSVMRRTLRQNNQNFRELLKHFFYNFPAHNEINQDSSQQNNEQILSESRDSKQASNNDGKTLATTRLLNDPYLNAINEITESLDNRK